MWQELKGYVIQLPYPRSEADWRKKQRGSSHFGLKSSYIQEILLASYFREGYYLDIPGSEYDGMTR
jgi:hypothetical protein